MGKQRTVGRLNYIHHGEFLVPKMLGISLILDPPQRTSERRVLHIVRPAGSDLGIAARTVAFAGVVAQRKRKVEIAQSFSSP